MRRKDPYDRVMELSYQKRRSVLVFEEGHLFLYSERNRLQNSKRRMAGTCEQL